MSDLETLIRSELRARADDIGPRPEWGGELLAGLEPAGSRGRRVALAAIAASVAIALLIWGRVVLGGDLPVEPVRPLPSPTPAPGPGPGPVTEGDTFFLGSGGTGVDALLYQLTQEDECESGCGSTLWSSDASGRTRLHDFRPDEPVYTVTIDPESGAGLAFYDGRTEVLRTADGGRSWTREDHEFALYGFPSDVTFLDGWIYLYTVRYSGGGPTADDYPHLWRSAVGSEEWTEVALPAGAGEGFVFPVEGPDGVTSQLLLADTRRSGEPLGWTYDGSTWSRVQAEFPCDSSSDLVHGPSATFYVSCRDGVQLTVEGSVDLGPFEQVGTPIDLAGAELVVGPFPVVGRDTSEHPVVVLRDGDGHLLVDNGSTAVEVPSALANWADVAATGLVTHVGDTTYVRATDGTVAWTDDGGRTWSQ